MSDETQSGRELRGAGRNGDEGTSAVLAGRHRDRPGHLARPHVGLASHWRVGPADVVQEA